ncbi:MAG: glycosyltransferase family 4 protein [Psychroflexus sp.]|nr:glycosyltransferase family 4 protein [Psychroflexus sp.]MDN6309866.1 glycosyltransferase family 4 protein [Psychroflexus sp.]
MTGKKLLIIGFVWPEPNSSAAGSRMMQLIRLFLSKGFEVTYASPAKDSIYAEDLSDYRIQTQQISANDSEFDNSIKALNPSHVLFDRFMMEEQFGWRVAENCPEAIRILDTQDLHFFRKARQRAYEKKQSFVKSLLLTDEAKREIASIYRSDLSLIISQAEMELLRKHFKLDKKLLLYLPFLVDSKFIQKDILPAFEERKDFVSIGNFLHPPNFDKTKFLKREIWPLIKKELPAAKLFIYGAYTSQKVEQLHQPKDDFYIMGRAADAVDVIKASRVLLAPLRFGAGLKGKFIDGMRAGTPAITTTIGAEGICGDLPWCGEIANEPQLIAQQAVKLYSNKKRWTSAQKNGFQILEKRFRASTFKALFFKRLNKLESELSQHRQQNFIGQMLMHHSHQSTKYMSRWIEEKNKKN